MFERILFATDFSEPNLKILDYLPQFSELGVEEVVVVRVINLNRLIGAAGGININEYIEVCQKEAESKLVEVVNRISSLGFKAKPVIPVPAGDPVNEIVKVAKQNDAKLILMGSRGRGLIKEILLGSVSEGVVRRSDIPVMVIKHKTNVRRLFDKIIYAHDLKDHSDVVMKYVKYIANRTNCEILLVHVVEKEEFAENKLKAIEDELSRFKFKTVVRHGTPHKEILKVCDEESATSIFIGGGIPETVAERLLGSTADAILRYSKVPVFVAKS